MRNFSLFCCCLFIACFVSATAEDVLRPGNESLRQPESLDSALSAESQAPDSLEAEVFEIGIGLVAGMNHNMFSADLRNAKPDSQLEVLTGGNDQSPLVGVFVEFLPLESIGFQLKFSYDSKNYQHTDIWRSDCSNSERPGIIEDSFIERSVETSIPYFAFAGLLRFDLFGRLSMMVGPTIQVTAGDARGRLSDELLSPAECFFHEDVDNDGLNDTESRRRERSISVEPDQMFRWGAEMALAYRLLLSERWIVAPELGFQYFITFFHANDDLTDDSRPISELSSLARIENQLLHSLQFRLTAMHTF